MNERIDAVDANRRILCDGDVAFLDLCKAEDHPLFAVSAL